MPVCPLTAIAAVLLGTAALVGGLWQTAIAGIVVTAESFDSDPNWVGFNNTAGMDSFGFSTTNNTGHASGAGEAGGALARNTVKAYYADVFDSTAPELTLDDHIRGAGMIDIGAMADAAVTRIGHLNSATSGSAEANWMGIGMADGNRFFAAIGLSNGTAFLSDEPVWSPSGVYRYAYHYDPSGNGALTVKVSQTDGTLVGTSTLTLNGEQRAIGASFDAFGLGHASTGSPSEEQSHNYFIDGVTYTEQTPFVADLSDWVGFKNTADNNNYTNTPTTAGGHFEARFNDGSDSHAFLADTTLQGGPLGFDDVLAMSGTLTFDEPNVDIDPNWFFGWYDSSNPTGPRLALAPGGSNSPDEVRWVILSVGDHGTSSGSLGTIADGSYPFSLISDPTTGQITASIGTYSATLDITHTDFDLFDRFGFFQPGGSNDNNTLFVELSDFNYTGQSVPEPSTLTLLGMGLLGCFFLRRANRGSRVRHDPHGGAR